ncbi:hypothetical protein L9F63_018192, partial [Diploptera punctata]
ICFALPSLADWRVTSESFNITYLIKAEILHERLDVIPELVASETPNFLMKIQPNLRISNCTYIYFTNSSQNEYWTCCSYMDVETLHKILRNNYIEVIIDQKCIENKVRDSAMNISVRSKNFQDIKINWSQEDIYQHGDDTHNAEMKNDKSNNDVNSNENVMELSIDYVQQELKKVKSLLKLIEQIKKFQKIALNKTDFVTIDNELKNIRGYIFKRNAAEKESFTTKTLNVYYLTNVGSRNQNIRYNFSMFHIQNGSVLSDIPWIRCLLTLKLSDELDEEYDQDEVPIINIFRKYIDPIVHSIIFTIGVIWNGVLILIFVRQRHLWTPPNIMVFNLGLVDLFALFFSVLAFCFSRSFQPYIDKNEFMCKYFVTVRPLTIALSCLSVVALSMLRYVATGKKFCSAFQPRSL